MKMKDIMIDRLNAEQELKNKIIEILMPLHQELAELKADAIMRLTQDFYLMCASLSSSKGICGSQSFYLGC